MYLSELSYRQLWLKFILTIAISPQLDLKVPMNTQTSRTAVTKGINEVERSSDYLSLRTSIPLASIYLLRFFHFIWLFLFIHHQCTSSLNTNHIIRSSHTSLRFLGAPAMVSCKLRNVKWYGGKLDWTMGDNLFNVRFTCFSEYYGNIFRYKLWRRH